MDYIWIIYGFDIWLCMDYGLDLWYIIWNNYGKSQFSMGKSTISMAMFNCLFVCLPGRVCNLIGQWDPQGTLGVSEQSKVGRPAGQSASFQPFEDGVFIQRCVAVFWIFLIVVKFCFDFELKDLLLLFHLMLFLVAFFVFHKSIYIYIICIGLAIHYIYIYICIGWRTW